MEGQRKLPQCLSENQENDIRGVRRSRKENIKLFQTNNKKNNIVRRGELRAAAIFPTI